MKELSKGAAALLVVSSAALAQDPSLSTRPGVELGAQVSYYEYTEPYFPNVPVTPKISGYRLGIVGAGTYTGAEPVFARLELRASYGSLDYAGTGTISGVPDYIVEARGLVGTDLAGANASLSPYLGFGYRYLFNDLRGYGSNSGGYRRYSTYLYVPVGVTVRFPMRNGWVLAPTLEGDIFLQGTQVSNLSDTGIPGYIDVTNRQDSGKGYRASAMLERGRWAFGAWMQYWHIGASDVQFAGVVQGIPRTGQEPENFTREYGIEARYRF